MWCASSTRRKNVLDGVKKEKEWVIVLKDVWKSIWVDWLAHTTKNLSQCSQDARKPISVPVCKLSVYLQPFRRILFLECALQPKIVKINKNPYFESLGSFKVIDVDTTKKLVTSACCDRQHAHGDLQLFSRKTGRLLQGYRYSMPSCASFLECRKSRLGPSRLQRSSLLECVSQCEITKKSIKPHFVVQGRPRSLNSIPIESQCMNSY